MTCNHNRLEFWALLPAQSCESKSQAGVYLGLQDSERLLYYRVPDPAWRRAPRALLEAMPE
jgi:hypothetical protein